MSNPLKAIGRVFKKVVKTVKKIALPALAIGAAILTGGAALGILPSVGSVLGAGGLGLSAGLTSVLTTAGQGALGGILTSAVTGKNILKGAATGFAIGGIAGGIGQIAKPAASAASGATSTVANAVDDGITVTRGAANALADVGPAPITVAGNTGSSIAAGGVASGVAPAAVERLTPPPTPQTTPVSSASGGGIGSFLERNPFLTAGLVQGFGSGLLAGSEAKAETRRERERLDRNAANYEGSGHFYESANPIYAPVAQRPRMIWKIDPVSGDAYQTYDDRPGARV